MSTTTHEPPPELIDEINELIEQANHVGASATEFSAHRLRLCVAVGSRFAALKKMLPSRVWLSYCAEKFPKISPSTVQRWKRVAEAVAAGTLDLDTAKGQRQAYAQCGLLRQDTAGKDGNKPAKPAAVYLVLIARLTACLERLAASDLDDHSAQELRRRLEPLNAVIARLPPLPPSPPL
jgi:hypothetical protein